MNGKVIDIFKHMSREDLLRIESRNVKLPKVYNVRIALIEEGIDRYFITFEASNKTLYETIVGREYMFEHLVSVVLSMCEEDPMLVTDLLQRLELFFGSEQDD